MSFESQRKNTVQNSETSLFNMQTYKEDDLACQIKALLRETINNTSLSQVALWIIEKLEDIDAKIERVNNSSTAEEIEKWMNVQELSEYLPSHPATQTIYGWTSCHQIPYHKRGKRIMFLKSEIDVWLHGGRQKSRQELEEEARQFIASKKRLSFQTRYSFK